MADTENEKTLDVASGESLYDYTLANDAMLRVAGSIQDTKAFGSIVVLLGGEADRTTIMGEYDKNLGIAVGGSMEIRDGGTARNTTVQGKLEGDDFFSWSASLFYGTLTVNGGFAENTVLEAFSFLEVCSGRAKDLTIHTDGYACVQEGGVLTGCIAIDEYGMLEMAKGGILDFNLQGRTTEAPVLLNDFTRVIGEDAIYTITIDETLTDGVYRLAGNAASFAGSMVLQTDALSLGTVSKDMPLDVPETELEYSLQENNGVLELSVCHIQPDQFILRENLTRNMAQIHILQRESYAFRLEAPDGKALDLSPATQDSYLWNLPGGITVTVQGCTNSHVLSQATNMPRCFESGTSEKGTDFFFAKGSGIWSSIYSAKHLGNGSASCMATGETVRLAGKNILEDMFLGGAAANLLFLTDDENGDALFLEDVYSDSADNRGHEEGRLHAIREIFAGNGDDIIDMTSQKFPYSGNPPAIHGGEGNDILWANSGRNRLFGDGGDDRLVGAGDTDLLAGGEGNDSMHGNGGEDIFTFGCGTWGQDTVSQTQDGDFRLWFEEGLALDDLDFEQLGEDTRILRLGTDDTITVQDISKDILLEKLLFGSVGTPVYAGYTYDALKQLGAFADSTHTTVFTTAETAETGK